MTRLSRSAWWAAGRLLLVVAALAAFGLWWARQKEPDFRVDLRVRLRPGVLAAPLENRSALTLAGEQRDAVQLPAGRVLRLQVTVPGEHAVLRFHDGHLLAQPELVVRVVRADGDVEVLGRHETSEQRWTARSLPLDVPPGEAVTVEFAALDGSGEAEHGAVLLADIVLDSDGRGVDETEIPIRTRAVVADLLARHGDARVPSPPTTDSARHAADGPPCVPLVEGAPFFVSAENLPAASRLDVVLHLGRPYPDGPLGPGRVVLSIDDQPVAALPLDLGSAPDPLSTELLFAVDLRPWGGRPVDVSLQREGGENLFVGVLELAVSAPVTVSRLVWQPGEVHRVRNVLLITVDSLRADRLGCYGHAGAHTPAIDALAARGGRYERLLAPSSWALPTVASLLTGVSPVTHGLGLEPGRVLSPRLATLAQCASWSGLTTALFSSSPWVAPRHGLDQGFETFVVNGLPAPVLAEQALDWLEQAAQFRWFLVLHFADPGYPYLPPPEDATRLTSPPSAELIASLRRLDSRPGAAEALAREIGPMYDAEVAAVDRAIGMLVGGLRRKGLLDDTLVVVVGSQGEEFYEHRGRLFGQTLFDEVVRVPLVLAGPGIHGADGRPFVEREPIEMVDVTRLIAGVGDLSSQSTLQGRLPPPFGPRLPSPVAHAVLAPFPSVTAAALHASRSGDWLALTDEATGRRSLFDLRDDPLAQVDLLAGAVGAEARFQADSLESAFGDWWRGGVLTAVSRPIPCGTEAP